MLNQSLSKRMRLCRLLHGKNLYIIWHCYYPHWSGYNVSDKLMVVALLEQYRAYIDMKY